MNPRKLKVRKGYYDRYHSRTSTRRHPDKPFPPVPFIQVKGYWMEDFEFAIGTELKVEVERRRIVITAVPESELARIKKERQRK